MKKQVSLPDFIDFLNLQTPTDFKGDTVDKFFSENCLNNDDFLPFIYFREETYGRNLVYKTEHFELLVLTWLPQQRTPIHDHAGQRCWVTVSMGELAFKNYEVAGLDGSKCDLRAMGGVEIGKCGTNAYIDDGIAVHSIANASRCPAVSIHLYAAPVTSCLIYSEKNKRFEKSELQYFTIFDGDVLKVKRENSAAVEAGSF